MRVTDGHRVDVTSHVIRGGPLRSISRWETRAFLLDAADGRGP
jgi:hypothetical protein